MKLTIWNKTVQGLIDSDEYHSILLGFILVRDKETLLQWWQYDLEDKKQQLQESESVISKSRNASNIGLKPLQQTLNLVKVWSNYFPYSDEWEELSKEKKKRGELDEEGWYDRDILEKKYQQYVKSLVEKYQNM